MAPHFKPFSYMPLFIRLRTILFLLIAGLAVGLVSAQSVSAPAIKWGKLSDHTKGVFLLHRTVVLEDRTLIWYDNGKRGSKTKSTIIALGENQEPLISAEYSAEYNGQTATVDDFLVRDGVAYVVERCINKFSDHAIELSIVSMDPESITARDDRKVLASMPSRQTGKSISTELNFTSSPDDQQFLIVGIQPRDINDPMKLMMWCYGSDWQLQWERSLDWDLESFGGLMSTFRLTNEGEVFFLADSKPLNKYTGVGKSKDFKPSIVAFDPIDGSTQVHPLGFNDIYDVRGVLISTDDDMLIWTGHIRREGYFSDREFFFYALDVKTGEPLVKVTKPLEEPLDELDIFDVAYSSSGIIYVLAEHRPLGIPRDFSAGAAMVIGIDLNSEKVWAYAFGKNQVHESLFIPKASCKGVVNGPFYHVLYTGFTEAAPGEGDKNGEEEALLMAVFDEQGFVGKEQIITTRELGAPACPAFISPAGPDRFFILAWENDQFRAGIGTFD